jgi:hypothetical protein
VARSARASSQTQVMRKRFLAVYRAARLFRKRSYMVTAALGLPWRVHARSWAFKALVGLLDSARNSSAASCANRGAAGVRISAIADTRFMLIADTVSR